MKRLAICAVVLASAACQPQAERQASIVTDAVLVRQNASQVQEDAVRMLLAGKWDCTGVASGISMTMKSDFSTDGSLQSGLHMVSPDMDLTVSISGRWVVKGFTLKQNFTSAGDLSGSLNGQPITPEASSGLKDAILGISTDPETITISDSKFTLIDGEGVITTCTR